MKATISFIMLLISAAAYGQLYKCIGKDGRVEYASTCPPGTRQEATGIRSAPASSAVSSPAQKSLADQEAEFRKRRAEQQEAQVSEQKKLAEAEQRRRACDDARAYLKALEEGQRIVRVDPKTGERSYLEDAQYATEKAVAQRSVEANCK